MNARGISPQPSPHVTIRVSGKLFRGHLDYLDQLVNRQPSAICGRC